MSSDNPWYKIHNENDVFSPSLLVYSDRVEENIRRMIAMAGAVTRLRPHVKTHKMPEIIRLQMNYGISKFKCATISEAEMVARCGVRDILLAMQPVGPAIERFFRLKQAFRNSEFSCIADSEQILIQLSDMASHYNSETLIWIDINVGMNRTGIAPGAEAVRIFKIAEDLPKLKPVGLHVYDGHIHEKNPALREQMCNDAFAPVQKMKDELNKAGFSQVRIVAGGTPTFPIHGLRNDVELSPGTILLWDFGYSSSFADMDFLNAALLFTRVVSIPARDLVCIDLGHKAVASEMPQPRISIPSIDDLTIIGHSEEHMVIRTSHAGYLRPGDALYAVPRHICPTVDRFDTAYIVTDSRVRGRWNIEARKRQITF